MTISWQDSIIRGALVLGDIYGATVMASPVINTANALSVRPLHNTGHKAAGVIVYPTANCHFSVDAAPNTLGLYSALLIAEQEYVFPLQPSVNTMFFLDAASASNAVYVRYVMPD